MAITYRALFTCLLLLATCAHADWRATLPAAQLQGSGDFTWFGLRLYTARLWTTGGAPDWQQPFALELRYHRSLSRDTLVQASVDEIRRLNAGTVPARQLEDWARAMHQVFVDVQPGTRITGVYLPRQGCRFYVDGKLSGEVPDPAFARAFLGIWLDPRARDPQLRQRLLGLADDRGE